MKYYVIFSSDWTFAPIAYFYEIDFITAHKKAEEIIKEIIELIKKTDKDANEIINEWKIRRQ